MPGLTPVTLVSQAAPVTLIGGEHGIAHRVTTFGMLGPQGPAGADGSPGPQGPAGADGAPGLQGARGADGAVGPEGPAGPPGPPGVGAPGKDGQDGADGAEGPAGPPGPAGNDGQPGAAGKDGADGAQGPAGPPGNDGAPGAAGKDGADGAKGDPGADGAPGAAGRGITSIVRTAGTGAPGTIDTYTITFTDASTTAFDVYNGADGASGGSGDPNAVKVTGDQSVAGVKTFTNRSSHAGAYTPPVLPTHRASPTFDCAVSNVFEPPPMLSNIGFTLENAQPGQTVQIRFEQDAVGTRTVILPAGAKVDGSPLTLPGRVSWLVMTYSARALRWEGNWVGVPA